MRFVFTQQPLCLHCHWLNSVSSHKFIYIADCLIACQYTILQRFDENLLPAAAAVSCSESLAIAACIVTCIRCACLIATLGCCYQACCHYCFLSLTSASTPFLYLSVIIFTQEYYFSSFLSENSWNTLNYQSINQIIEKWYRHVSLVMPIEVVGSHVITEWHVENFRWKLLIHLELYSLALSKCWYNLSII